jgi:membrane protein DedA with SNARE-associated domain
MSRPVPNWLRRLAIAVAAIRYVVPLAAVPLIPLLILPERLSAERLTLLILLRPTKEFVLLAGGTLAARGWPDPLLVLAAYVPFMVVAVWAFFIVGRAYRDVLGSPDAPRWLTRAVPPDRLALAQRVLEHHGPAIAFLGRLAALPPTVLAAAAGASRVPGRAYLVADLVGAFVAFALTLGAGYALGETFERSGLVLTAAGVALFVLFVVLLTRWIRSAADEVRGEHGTA